MEKDKKTVSFQYLNGKTVGDALGEAIVMGEVPYQELETVMKVLFPEMQTRKSLRRHRSSRRYSEKFR